MEAHIRSHNTPKWPYSQALSGSKEKYRKIFSVTMVTMQETAIFDHFAYFWGFLGSHGSMSAYTRSCNTPKWPSNQGLTGSKEKIWKLFSVTMVTMQKNKFLTILPIFEGFWGPTVQWVQIKGCLIHQNDRLIKPYQDQKKNN